MTLYELEKQRQQLKNKMIRIENEYHANLKRVKGEIKETERHILLHSAGIHMEKYGLGARLLKIKGEKRTTFGSDERVFLLNEEMIDKAREDIANDLQTLSRKYLAIKEHGGFGFQFETVENGKAPKHGSIQLSIELERPTKPTYTEEEKEAMLYYLLNLETILTRVDKYEVKWVQAK